MTFPSINAIAHGVHIYPNCSRRFEIGVAQLQPFLHNYVTSQFWLEGLSVEKLLDAGISSASTNDGLEKDGNGENSNHCGEHSDTEFSAHAVMCGSLLTEWLRRRDGQRGQCPHDAITLI